MPTSAAWICLITLSLAQHVASIRVNHFIAALGPDNARTGKNAHLWGFWELDPGPRGVKLKDYHLLEMSNGFSPAGWEFNISDWWVEEYGRIMEKPRIALRPGKYTIAKFMGYPQRIVLTVYPMNRSGTQDWRIDSGKLVEVTHGPCRTGRYTPATESSVCSPANMPTSNFPVAPGAKMPTLEGCSTLDYRVLFVYEYEEFSAYEMHALMQTISPDTTMAPAATTTTIIETASGPPVATTEAYDTLSASIAVAQLNALIVLLFFAVVRA